MDVASAPLTPITDFDLAALACGHDVDTETGRSAARHDRAVWDLLDELIDTTITESVVFLAGAAGSATVADHIAAARKATRA